MKVKQNDYSRKKIIVVSPTNPIITQYQKRLEENEIDYRNVEFLTYSKIMNMSKEEIEKLKAENIVLDEFHHCGAEEWGKGVKRLLEGNSSVKVLGLSATPIRYLDNLRNMAEEVFEGNIASEISLPEALVDGLLEIPIYHQGLYSVREEEEKRRAMIESLSDEEAKEALRKELEKVKDAASKIEGTKEILTKGIPEDKNRMIALLELGVRYPTDRKKKEKMKECVGKQVKNNRKAREELERIARSKDKENLK